jgi:hypothetical protein
MDESRGIRAEEEDHIRRFFRGSDSSGWSGGSHTVEHLAG